MSIQVTSGILRGVPLRSPTGPQTRPSSARLRQATFNVLRHFRFNDAPILEGAIVADVFAGTGAWGIEALSNGATEACFIESHPNALKALQANVATATQSFEKQNLDVPTIHLVKQDVAISFKKLPETRLMFCDPPYEAGWFERVVQLEKEHGRIVPNGLLLYEADLKEKVPADTGLLKLFDSKIYGDSAVHFFVKH